MTEDNFDEFVRRITGPAQVLRAAVTEPWLREYFEALKHLDFAALDRSLTRAVRECKFFPMPVELREMSYIEIPYEQSPDLDEQREVCRECFGVGVRIRDVDGVKCGSPCSCSRGRIEANSWEKVRDNGTTFGDSARHNSRLLRERGE